ncbi:hydantoinase/oxoprolinase family protein [Streptomyces sp. NEAU-Y11]|uniref:hydantoinase/oxoprolinase family protein n=1 Tax=Streptomyces cucumeris TaxID=2962890 RepID=UPI0020C8A24D|nr:hydantoinase/oxoprolinase family protein [Streptomyces sp. NEAU-Y11]MCP9206530.1 hydantoinase/oxoprolinase family protein [Streptomyces sp. NEAU-Y11]
MSGPAKTARDAGSWRVAADIGGTFTDVIALGPGGRVVPVKVLSTPPDFGSGVLDGTAAALSAADALPRQVGAMLHATTVATNAILEARGARTALVTTRGFRDVLELGRLRRPRLYDLSWQRPTPLVPRRHRYEIDQRITADGRLEPPADPAELARVAAGIAAADLEAVAVCLINSYVRPEEERRVADELRALLPGRYVTASVDITPQMQEYERTSTAVVNSYVGPQVHDYVTALGEGLREAGVSAPLMIMQSSGGLLDAPSVVRRPVQIIESGPAAGVIAVQKLARHMGLASVVAFDMGGTTAKASLIENGEPFVAGDYEVGGGMNITRGMGKGAGYALRVPSIDIAEVGAGGGSVISTDAAGSLRVGPDSAGSRPGPACYGNGGTSPTLTDANVVLGYLSPQALAGGRVAISPDLAEKAIDPVARDLGVDVPAAARGAYQVAVSSMTKAVKAVTSERGRDPREAVMVAFGGAGPLYGAAIARELGIDTVIVPVHTGLFSSLGLLVADTERQAVTPHRANLEALGLLTAEFDRMAQEVTGTLLEADPSAEPDILRILDMRYRGQRFELSVTVPGGPLDPGLMAAARQRFHAEHHRTYGRTGADELVEIVNLRVRGRIRNPVGIEAILSLPPEETRPATTRACRFDRSEPTPVITRAALSADLRPGPLVIEDMDATTLVPPGATAHLDHLNNIVIVWTTTAPEASA